MTTDLNTEITIDQLGAAGDGIANASGAPIYAAFTLPGEVVSGEIANNRLSSPSIITASPDRQKPLCQHFAACGGCALQHANDDFVAGWKRDQIAKRLSQQGVPVADIRPTITSAPFSRRRATFTARRTKKTVQVGFHRHKSDEVIPLTECHVLHPDLLAARLPIQDAAKLGASRKGAIKAQVTLTEGGLDIAVSEAKPLEERFAEAAALAETHDLARLTWNGETVVTRRLPYIRFGTANVAPPSGGFLQATEDGEAALVAAAIEAAGNAKRYIDLFAGCGTFALHFASKGEVHAAENDQAALAALDKGWRNSTGMSLVTTEVRDLFRRPVWAAELNEFQAAIIDPPRAGAEAQMAEIAKSELTRLAAISCDPATFARDAAILKAGGWTLDWVQPVDQFRWSPHIELAARFSR
ncbi:MAG: class I SAM-dependent RNA methyltransferase [Pikeienuella sp.]